MAMITVAGKQLNAQTIELTPFLGPQTRFRGLARLYARALGVDGYSGLKFWIGTNPVPVHRLGAVTWTRRMQGARVGRRSYPRTWSWPAGPTKGLVMERIGTFGRNGNPRLERIDRVDLPIHEAVSEALDAARPAIMARFETLLSQEINYAL
ncbi:MAG: hypothetical protein R6W31_10805, partial [Bacteroidales bacterium]